MGVPPFRLAAAALMLGSGLTFANVAAAADARKIADDIVSLINSGGETTASYADAANSGNDVSITGLKLTDNSDGTSVEIGQVLITNPVDRQPGGFTADRITIGNGKTTNDGTTVGWATIEVDKAVVPDESEVKTSPNFLPFTRLAINGMSVVGGELTEQVNIGAFEVTLGGVVNNVPAEGTLSLTGLEVPLSLIDAEQRPVIQQLGYNNGFTINVSAAGGYAHETDTINLTSLAVDVENAAKIEFGGVFSGVPLSKLQTTEGMQEVLATAKIENARIRFDNSGIVEKLLDMQAQQMGTTRADLVTQFSAAMPMMLNVIGNPGFQAKVAAALTAFMNDPKSLTIVATPTAPVPVMQIIGIGQSAPQTLPDVLSVGITAND